MGFPPFLRSHLQQHDLNHVLLGLGFLAGTLDESRQVTDGDLEWEVQRSQHNSKEYPPSSHARDERECTSSNLESASQRKSRSILVTDTIGILPVRASEQTERAHEREEDDYEGHVGAQRADQVDQAEQAHEDEEEGEGGCESNSGLAGCYAGGAGWGVGPVGCVKRLESGGKGKPEGAEGHEDDEGEGVAEDELEEAADEHEKTAEEEVGSAARG